MKRIKLFLLLLVNALWVLPATAQEERIEPQKEFVQNVFIGTQLINAQTTNVLPAKAWAFEIQHRFGKIGIDSTFTQQFLGLDLPSVIRLGFGYSLSDRMYFKIGRTNHLKTIDFETKYLMIKQTEDFKVPVSVALYFDAALRTERFPNVQDSSFFEDDVTPFEYKPSHRLAYNTQVIISSKLTERLSLQLSPIFIYNNLTQPYTDNFTLVLGSGGRYKTGMSSGIIFEYAYVFNNRGTDFHDPFSFGYEFGTVGHTFQIFVSSASKILETHIYNTSAINMADGEFLIGFNLQRNFWRKNSR